MTSCAVYHRQKHINSSSAKLSVPNNHNAGTMESSGLALTALLVFAVMSAVLANPYPYPGRNPANYQYPKNAEEQQFRLESAEEQQFSLESAEEQQWLNAKKQWQSNNAGEQYGPPMALVDLQGLSENAMYNGMESALAMQELAGTQQGCLVNLNIPIAFVGNLNIQVCPKATNAGCDRVSVTLGRIVNTRVVVCDKGNQQLRLVIVASSFARVLDAG